MLRKQADKIMASINLENKPKGADGKENIPVSKKEQKAGNFKWIGGICSFVFSGMIAYVDGRLCRCIPNSVARRIWRERMAFIVSKKQLTLSEEEKVDCNNVVVVEEEREEAETPNTVIGQIYLKPSHTTETLDKDQVLCRIRHRKRMNKLRNALQALLSFPFSSTSDGPDKVPNHRHHSWLDDAFSAP